MYLPAHFEEKDGASINAFIAEYPLAAVVTKIDSVFEASSIPLMVQDGAISDDSSTLTLIGHIAAKNPLGAIIKDSTDCLVIFKGPNSYITPSWYPTKKEHAKVVPTWNYAEIHCHGRLRLIDDSQQKKELVTVLTDKMEALENVPWHVDDAPNEYIDMMLNNIIGVEISVHRIEAKLKANQNHPQENRLGAIIGLRERGGDYDRAMAELMNRAKS